MDKEKNYWEIQYNTYMELPYEDKKKYMEWQPARWAGNYSAIYLMKDFLKDVKTVAEVGAGSAAFSIALYQKLNDLKLTAIDISSVAIKYGKKISKDMNIPIDFINTDLFDVKGKYDLVCSLGVIEHYEKDEMQKFIEKNIELSNKYILVAIPNQNSMIFKNYVEWTRKKNKEYEEEHKCFNNSDLIEILEKNNLEILIEDGFQVFLSEGQFLSEDFKNNDIMIRKLKLILNKYDKLLSGKFPNYNFSYDDIEIMNKVENELSKEYRKEFSFMSFVLAQKK